MQGREMPAPAGGRVRTKKMLATTTTLQPLLLPHRSRLQSPVPAGDNLFTETLSFEREQWLGTLAQPIGRCLLQL